MKSFANGSQHATQSNSTPAEFLETELSSRDIRQYLQQWKNAQPRSSNIDPIRIPDPNEQNVWIGNMLCDEVIQDSKVPDRFEMERYQHLGDDVQEARFLRPGDLVLMKS